MHAILSRGFRQAVGSAELAGGRRERQPRQVIVPIGAVRSIEISAPDPACLFGSRPATDHRSTLNEMRKVVVQQFVTLDGFAGGPNGELDFVTETGTAADPTSGPFVEDQLAFIESLDTILPAPPRTGCSRSTGPSRRRRRSASPMR
jgi:hypothetical protein